MKMWVRVSCYVLRVLGCDRVRQAFPNAWLLEYQEDIFFGFIGSVRVRKQLLAFIRLILIALLFSALQSDEHPLFSD